MTIADPRRRNDADPAPGDAVRAIGRLAERLCPDRRDPEAFHARKSELIAAIRRHARTLDQGPGR